MTDDQRYRPGAVVGDIGIEGERPLLDVKAMRGGSGGDDGMTALVDPVVHQRLHRLTRDRFERGPQVGGFGVRVRVGFEVVAHAVAEDLGAEVLLEHADDGGALLVGEEVEHPLGFLWGDDRELDRAGRGEGVDVERCRSGPRERVPDSPVGPVGVAAARLHERGEGLVQPDPLPPLHRDEVAEPHVGEFMVDDVGGPLEFGLACVGRVDDQQHFAERHAAEVFHRTEREVGDGDQINLVGGVGDCVVVGKPVEGCGGDIESERGAVALTGAVDDADGHAARMDRFGGLQRPDDKSDEVGRHHHRRGVLNAATAIVEGGLGDLARVGDGEMVGIDDQRCLEGRLVFGLVPAREATTSVGRLELGGGDRVLGAVVGGVRRPIEAVKLIVEGAVERHLHGGGACGDLAVEGEREPLGFVVERGGSRVGGAVDHD